MELDLEAIRDVFVRQAESWLEMMPPNERTRPLFGFANANGDMLSATDIVQEMKDQTSLGNEFLTQAIGLAAAEAALVGSTRK